MGEVVSGRRATAFGLCAFALLAACFAFAIFTGWVIVQYGVRTTDLGWQAQRIGDTWYLNSVSWNGPAQGVLRAGDRIVSIGSQRIDNAESLGLALRSIAGGSLYSMVVSRQGREHTAWLRAHTRTGFAFFRERFPLLVSSFLFFLAAAGMLSNWRHPAAGFGFIAAATSTLRMGAWAILPLSSFFSPAEHRFYFLFWLPVCLSLPATWLAVSTFLPGRRPTGALRYAGWALLAAIGAFWLFTAAQGAVPAPVPEGTAYVFRDRIEYRPHAVAVGLGIPLLLIATVLLSAVWIWRLWTAETRPDARRRLSWLLLAGGAFAVVGVTFEIRQWLGIGSGAIGWSWLGGALAIAFSYLVTSEQVAGPRAVLRAGIAAILPQALFSRLDAAWFPDCARREQELDRLIAEAGSCHELAALESSVRDGIERGLDPESLSLNTEAPPEEILQLGPRRSGEPYSSRERKRLRRLARTIALARQRLQQPRPSPLSQPAGKEAAGLNLLHECPRCGACYDSSAVRCHNDGRVTEVKLPIERILEGKYRLDRRIGKGGMGAVYSGRDLRLNRRIAVKVMLSELFGHEEALRRFEREAQAAARLNHPNIIQIFDYGPIGTMGAFLVMEFVEGSNWREAIREGGVPAAECLPWIRQLLDGIAAAHAAGIVHRDLKPENLLLSNLAGAEPLVKILDFGLAKMQMLHLSRQERLSLDVQAIGTVGYVPPEQLTGGIADERSDIYAIGRIVAETLTGSLPESEPFSLAPPLCSVLQRATAHRKEDRYPTVFELRKALLAALGDPPSQQSSGASPDIRVAHVD